MQLMSIKGDSKMDAMSYFDKWLETNYSEEYNEHIKFMEDKEEYLYERSDAEIHSFDYDRP